MSVTDLLTPSVKGDEAALRKALTAGFTPISRLDLRCWPVEVPIDWATDPFNDRNWRFQLHAWHMLRPHLTLYGKTADPGLLRTMLAVARDWASFHATRTTPFSWYDMAAGRRAELIALLLSAALRKEFSVTKAEMGDLLDLRESHLARLTDARFLARNNHALFQLHGLIALCEACSERAGVERTKKYVRAKFRELLALQFNAEGMHKEHSPEYHFFAMNVINTMLATGWYQGFDEALELMRRANSMAPWLRMPDGRLIPVGDTTGCKPKNPRQLAYSCPVARGISIGYGIVRGG